MALQRLWVSPVFWILFGLFGFPIVCFIAEIMGWMVTAKLGLWPKHGTDFGWGGALGLFLGAPLGIVSALCAFCWRARLYNVVRGFALVGGAIFGAGWLLVLLHSSPMVWLGDFGFAVTPLLWALALILFALLARQPVKCGSL